jgi:hypothetical protein
MNMVRAFWISIIVGAALAACAPNPVAPVAAAPAQCYWLSNDGAGWVAQPDLPTVELCYGMDSCAGGEGASSGGCYKWATGKDEPVRPWSELGVTAPEPAQTGSGASCYIRNEAQGSEWSHLPGEREATCFQRDTCSGGLGREDGVCLKWAMGAVEPALPWSAALTNPKLAADIRPPEDIYAGSYEMTSDCHQNGCAYGHALFAAATPLYAKQDARSKIVATIPASECVLNTGNDALLSAPQRGVVLETAGRFTAGDVIYLTNYEGEGYSTVWRRGEFFASFSDEVVVRWDEAPQDPRTGYWVETTRANGQKGWTRDPEFSKQDCAFKGK